MWVDWRPDMVEGDFRLLAANGSRIVRLFPLGPDFQPIHALGTAGDPMKEIRFGEAPLPVQLQPADGWRVKACLRGAVETAGEGIRLHWRPLVGPDEKAVATVDGYPDRLDGASVRVDFRTGCGRN
jgi:hypothetical protein